MNIKEIIRKQLILEYKQYVLENLQLADKVYFNTNKLSQEDKKIIIGITNGDNYTKFIADVYYVLKDHNWDIQKNPSKELRIIYEAVKIYDKNVFPIVNYNGDLNQINIKNIAQLVDAFRFRYEIIKEIKQLPSIAIRNLKNDIRKPRESRELGEYLRLLGYFMGQFSLLNNKNDAMKEKIYKKMFKNNITLEELIDFADEKENMVSDVKVTKNEIINLANNHNDMTLVYKTNDVLVVRVESPQGIKDIGCNSLWCFTYGSGFDQAWRQWNNYSTNDIVYVIFDFREKQDSQEFMHVVIKPIDYETQNSEDSDMDVNDEKIFNMVNDAIYNPIGYLNHVMGLNNAKKIITFEWE